MRELTRPFPPYRASFATQEDQELRALVDQAVDLSRTPYATDACGSIVVWWERRALRGVEHRDTRRAFALKVIRETNSVLAAEKAPEAS